MDKHPARDEGTDDEPSSLGDSVFAGEPPRDPALARALAITERALYGERPNEERAASLRARLTAAAQPLLARLAEHVPAPRWWEWTARWSRAAISIGVTAGVAAALLVVASREWTARVIRERTLQGQPPIMRAAVSGTRSAELVESVVGPATSDWLLRQVFAGAPAALLRDTGEPRDSAAPQE